MKLAQEARNMVMALSASERACLAHDLILSLDEPGDYELSPSQEAEIQRRMALVREGTARGRSSDAVLSEIRASYPQTP